MAPKKDMKPMDMATVKSIWAVFAGFFTVVVLSVGTDFLLEALGIFPKVGEGFFVPWMLLLALFYRSAYTVLGGYVAAMLAPDRPILHVTILGIIGTIAGSIGVVLGWNLSPHWYPIALAVTAFPCIWLGGKLWRK